MSFEDDSRWDQMIAAMNYLAVKNWTGTFRFSMRDGRIHRRTVEDLREAVKLVKSSQLYEREGAVQHA